MHIEPESEDRVAQRLDGVFLLAVRGERSRERCLCFRSSECVGIEPEQISREVQELLELEQSFELSAQQIRLDHGS